MISFCMFGAYEGQLREDKRVYVTLFGGSELRRPTFAYRIQARRRALEKGTPVSHRPWIITLFGGTEIKAPTLVEEYLDLRELMAEGRYSTSEIERFIAEADSASDSSVVSITLFGGASECELPSENEEIDALALQRHLGTLSERGGDILQLGIGLAGAERRSVLRKAVQAMEK